MKFVTIFLFMAITALSSKAQDCQFYYPNSTGAKLTYHHYNEKNSLTGISEQEIIDLKTNNENVTGTIMVKVRDETGKELSETELKIECKEGVFYIDMKGYINNKMIEGFKDMDIEVESSNLSFPEKIEVNDELDDGWVKINVSNSGMKIMSMKVTISDRKVMAKENIKTEAGSFQCLKIQQKVTTDMMAKLTMKSIEWYSKGNGMIKNETYNTKGKLTGRTELVSLKLP